MTAGTVAGEVAGILLKSGAVSLNPEKPFRFTSGMLSPIYCDNRILLSMPSERERVVDFYILKIMEQKISFDLIAGIATASIPWAALIAQKMQKPMIYIRKEAKAHGKENLIEGVMKKGQIALIVEDLVSTGGSSIKAVNAVRDEGGIVNDCIAIFTYNMAASANAFSDANCILTALSDISALADFAAKNGYIKKEQLQLVLEWNSSPHDWGRKNGFE